VGRGRGTERQREREMDEIAEDKENCTLKSLTNFKSLLLFILMNENKLFDERVEVRNGYKFWTEI